MTLYCVECLLLEVCFQVGLEGRAGCQGQEGLSPIEHHGAQEAEIGRGYGPTVNGNDVGAGIWIVSDCTTIRIVHHRDGELAIAGEGQPDTNKPVIQ